MERKFNLEKPVIALSTPQGQSAIGILRISGKNLIPRIVNFFSKFDQLLLNPRKMLHGFFLDNAGNRVDEVMLSFFPEPSSYTGEDVIEIFFHGNMKIAQKIISILVASDFELALPGEFTYRAVMNGKIDLIKAEAIHELVTAKTFVGCQLALLRLSGELTTFCQKVYDKLLEYAAWVQMHLDYPQDEIEILPNFNFYEVISPLKTLIFNSQNMKKWQEGARVVLVGSPNVGKSSLFNLLVGYDRALVSNIAGTTRDYLEADIEILGHTVRVIDTAGIQHSEDFLEKMGIKLGISLLEEADLIICLLDQNNQEILLELTPYKDKILFVMNKSDLGYEKLNNMDILNISVLEKKNIDELLQKISERLSFNDINQNRQQLMLGSFRQQQLCEKALQHILDAQDIQISGDLDATFFHLQRAGLAFSEILGKNINTDVNDAMFSRFCLGK